MSIQRAMVVGVGGRLQPGLEARTGSLRVRTSGTSRPSASLRRRSPNLKIEDLTFGWTENIRLSAQRADPSGVQDASTVFQSTLLPGMSTLTPSVGYISLLAAAQYHLTLAGQRAAGRLDWRTFLRRFEALIAISSVRHHQDGDLPSGIIGRFTAVPLAQQEEFPLKLGLRNPPYNIYRGPLVALRVLDNSQAMDHLYERAKPLATAWDIDRAGQFAPQIRAGVLPVTASRAAVDQAAGAFCLCQVPQGSAEQEQVVAWLLGRDERFDLPAYVPGERTHHAAYRAVSWRLALGLVDLNPGPALAEEGLMARLLTPRLREPALPSALAACLRLWRWVAARTFFERGWTLIFDRALARLRQTPEGVPLAAFRADMAAIYRANAPDEPLAEIDEEARIAWDDEKWLVERFASRNPRDHLLLLRAGIAAAEADRAQDSPALLGQVWRERAIPFAQERARLAAQLRVDAPARDLWAELAEASLVEHVRSSLRKMHAGKPDSRLADFVDGRWLVPDQVRGLGSPFLSGGSTRLDIALRWARQLGLVRETGGSWRLTPEGQDACVAWDRVHRA